MNILVIPDKFKGTLTSVEAAAAIRAGVLAAQPGWQVSCCPVADGGEGTALLLTQVTNGTYLTYPAADPLGRWVQAEFGLAGNNQTAFIELASASGLHQVANHERNPLMASTLGTGQLIAAAISRGVREILLCLGGSATTDGGVGMATALGYRFLNAEGRELPPGGAALSRLMTIDDTLVLPNLWQTRFRVACDVTNLLCGPDGAARVYGPQKGADSQAIEQLDMGLCRLAEVVEQQWGLRVATEPGSGAAGGAGYGARVFLKAHLKPGFQLVANYLNLPDQVRIADLIITGEGKLDEQTLSGKVISGVVDLVAGRVPVVAFCGKLALRPDQVRSLGLQAAVAITPPTMPFAEATTYADTLLRAATTHYITRLTGRKPGY